ncbi:alkaline phosphatase [Rubripirellula obstinata]|nr:alkaline phosphatase [Rubripirellula obstinata]
MNRSLLLGLCVCLLISCSHGFCSHGFAQALVTADPAAKQSQKDDPESKFITGDVMRDLQSQSMRSQKAVYGHWGNQGDRFSNWLNHSNRLIPVYTFGITLDSIRKKGSIYSDPERLKQLYGRVPEATVNPTATYFDQTELHQLQLDALDSGFKNIIVVIFDGMDWQTTRAASIFKQGQVSYEEGRGNGLAFQDECRAVTDFGLIVTSAFAAGAKTDVNSQTVISCSKESTGGYDVLRGGDVPWHEQSSMNYLMGLDRERPHNVTDSAASATSITTGTKTYSGAINFAPDGSRLIPIARRLQAETKMSIGVVTSVPVSHATPAAAYANNVSRKDYQDIARDMLGLPSSSHRNDTLAGVDVLIGGGWGEGKKSDRSQGDNFATGNPYLHQDDLRKADIENGGKYVVAQRTKGSAGREVLMQAAVKVADNVAAMNQSDQAERSDQPTRLLGFFGTKNGHLPFQTADGDYTPTFDAAGTERYTDADIRENPTLADMTEAALTVLEKNPKGFWLMVEAGDVDWANHANNLDNSIGATLSGDAAFESVMNWIEANEAWDETAVIVTADHGHYLVLDYPEKIAEAGAKAQRPVADPARVQPNAVKGF